MEYHRITVDRWTDDHIEGHSSDGTFFSVPLSPDFTYLPALLSEGCQLNVITESEGGGMLIIYEPDALMDISSIAKCIESYGSLPYNYLLSQISPAANSAAIQLGNFASQLLDEQVHAAPSNIKTGNLANRLTVYPSNRQIPQSSNSSYADSIRAFFRRNAIQMALCPDLDSNFHKQAQQQKEHIRKVIHEVMPERVEGFDPSLVLLEPSFFSEMLGLQGRMDLLQLDYKVLIEQKAGKGAYPEGPDPDTPRQQPKHYVQMLLYMALLHYNFDIPTDHIQCFLLYSRYPNSLLPLGEARHLLLDALRVRNQVVWCEQWYAHGGTTFLERLQPEHLNENHLTDMIWDRKAIELHRLLAPFHHATPTERAYYHRMMAFLHREQWVGKVGSPTNPELGGATKWKLTLEEKVQAGCIYHGMTLVSLSGEENETAQLRNDENSQSRNNATTQSRQITEIVLLFPPNRQTDTTNFRLGDAVIVYPYDTVPDCRRTMVQRGYLHSVDACSLTVRLRAPQTDARVFLHSAKRRWAVEHDSIDSTYNALYRNLHAFLSASADRKALLLGQRPPRVDDSLTLRGDYGRFNDLVLRAKQAREMFLVIGPPGTGKTSFGLLNILKEEITPPQPSPTGEGDGTSDFQNQIPLPESRSETNSKTPSPVGEGGGVVLLLSYTNRAVDEICSKLVEEGLDFLRMGSEAASVEAYHDYLLENRVQDCQTVEDVRLLIRRTQIFVGTTTALNGLAPLFALKQFSLAIVDEASQILEPHILPLLALQTPDGQPAIRRFVLIGDHKQLPAVVQQTPAESEVRDPLLRDIGLTDCRNSFFQRMLARYADDPRVTYMLTRQGRMHPDIAAFPNEAFYDCRLDIAGLPHQLDSSPSPRVRFFDVPAPEKSVSDKVNEPEAELIAQLVEYELTSKTNSKTPSPSGEGGGGVGIIVPYRNQIATIRSAMARLGIPNADSITIDTVERFQGSQRDIIIYGFTVQKPYQLDFLTQGNFIENGREIDRKLNVAMTRARRYLYLVGNAALLRQDPVFRQMLDFLKG